MHIRNYYPSIRALRKSRSITLQRLAGELGWEIHTPVADTGVVFDALWRAGKPHGLTPFGMYALESLRLEKGYRAWKGDLSTDYTILQGGLAGLNMIYESIGMHASLLGFCLESMACKYRLISNTSKGGNIWKSRGIPDFLAYSSSASA